ncbi:hypothetical protein ACHAXA_008728 [Cyclostephanos tholiformis]|uniref:Uncharacterized protein n=1 Tax=Cyclostephanos tholiformis TaxID=382380 RepID=A0ABD3RBP2_9STRA
MTNRNDDDGDHRKLASPRVEDGRGGGGMMGVITNDDGRRRYNHKNARLVDDGRCDWGGRDDNVGTLDDREGRGGRRGGRGRWAGPNAYYRDDRYAHRNAWQEWDNRRRERLDDIDVRSLRDDFGRILRLEEAPLAGSEAEGGPNAKQRRRQQHEHTEMGTVVLSIVRAASMPTSEKTEPRVETSKDDVKYSGVDAGISRFGRKNVPAGSIARENDNDMWYRRGELNNDRIRPDGDRATLSTNATSRLHPRVVDLIVGLDSAERATAVRDACYANGTMLRTILGNIGFHGSSLVGENTNISGVRSWHKVDVKTYIATNADKRYTIIFEYSTEEKITTYRMRRLLTVFAKHKSPGFVEWLGGARGWRFDDCHDTATEGGGGASSSWKRCAVIKLNTLQEVFKLFAKDAQKYMFDNSQRMVWRKQNELTDVVNDIRVWIETITPQCELTRKLLRNSSTGPDCLVHWAHHHPKSFHPLTVVTESSMLELVEVRRVVGLLCFRLNLHYISLINVSHCPKQGLIELFQKEFHHSESDPLGTRWRNHEKRRSTDFDLANRHCPAWTTDYLERRLNGDDSIKKTNFSCS